MTRAHRRGSYHLKQLALTVTNYLLALTYLYSSQCSPSNENALLFYDSYFFNHLIDKRFNHKISQIKIYIERVNINFIYEKKYFSVKKEKTFQKKA